MSPPHICSVGFSKTHTIYGVAVIILLFLLFPVINISAQTRGLQIQSIVGSDTAVGKQWAVFIAIDRYREWSPLRNPVKDAKEIRDILTENYYIDEIRELYDANATAVGIRRLFSELRTQVGRDDSVFIFYAGHGHMDDLTNTGSWIPVDGSRDLLAQANWLPNIQIRNMLESLPAKHVFLISDSCFSGDMLDVSRGAGPVIDSDYYRRAYSRASRQVMTSGASEEVPDTSEFALRLKSSLRRADGACIDPQYLFTIVREVRNTQPMLGSIRGSEHQEGGSFLFFRKDAGNKVVLPDFNSKPQENITIGPPNIDANKNQAKAKTQYWSIGGSVGSAFVEPLLIGTVQGTLAPFKSSFFTVGIDAGFMSSLKDTDFWSVYPYVNYSYFLPFNDKISWYIGAGAGFMVLKYIFHEGTDYPFNSFAVNFTTGFNLWNFDVSYTRSNFNFFNSKVAVGYVFRFR